MRRCSDTAESVLLYDDTDLIPNKRAIRTPGEGENSGGYAHYLEARAPDELYTAANIPTVTIVHTRAYARVKFHLHLLIFTFQVAINEIFHMKQL